MLMLKAENIGVEINGKDILNNASMEINYGEHVALIGQNGIGKTTFLNAILGQIPISYGRLWTKITEGCWAWMSQALEVNDALTVRAFVEMENVALSKIKQELAQLTSKVGTDIKLAETYSECLQLYLDLNGYDWETRIEKELTQVGISEKLWDQPFVSLSGGQKTKVQLARMMVKDASFLIFDEPTNHLDVETISWLAKWIQDFRGTVLLVSHDRAFIDKVAQTTYELTNEGTMKYKGGYRDYKAQKDLERQTAEATYKRQEQERRQLQEAITHYRQWFTKAHNAASERDPYAKKRANKNMTRSKAKEVALERLEKNRIKKPQDDPKVNVSFENKAFSSHSMLYFDQVTFKYHNNHPPVFENLSFFLEKGDRLGIIGRNGAGKTTLLDLLTGLLSPEKGTVYHHPQLKIGYFKQELNQLPEDQTILDYILTLPNLTQSEARTILACFLFPKEDVFKPIKALSMGEKCRVAFVKLYLSEANLLVLDEPTNYLDITTREIIEEALEIYPGAVVLVTHDQYLLKKIINCVLYLEEKHYFPGTYEEWQDSRRNQKVDLEKAGRLKTLELQYTNLLSQELSNEEESTTHLDRIREIKKQIDQLK